MKLFGSLTSPYVRKTRIVLAEKKIDCELVVDNGGPDGSGIAHLNPLGRIPVLLLDDESTLFDSRVIVEYLDNLAPNSRLIPPPGRERILIKRWEALTDGICDAAVSAVMEERRPGHQKNQEWIERQHAIIVRSLAVAHTIWANNLVLRHGHLPGRHRVGSALGYLAFRFPPSIGTTSIPIWRASTTS
jgi:glutathione S-transferase